MTIKIIGLLLLSVACTRDVKFTYKDTVRVTGGFYKGCVGEVASYLKPILPLANSRYYVSLKTCPGESDIDKSEYLEEKDLSLLSDEYKAPKVTTE